MKGEIPVFRRCCVCVPLRYGLLAWGYFKMIADALILLWMAYLFIENLMMIKMHGNHSSRFYSDTIITAIAFSIFFADLIVTIVFIIGGHQKNLKLIRVFYIVSMGMWVLTLLICVITVVRTIMRMIQYDSFYWEIVLMSCCFYFVDLVVQSYFLLLLRSEIIKLRNSGEFRFVNNAAEAECTMTCEEKVAVEQIVKEVVIN